MKRLLLVLCVVAMGCGKNNPAEPKPVYTSVDGSWTFTTPDKSISVDFDLKLTGTTLDILNSKITVGGTQGVAVGTLTGVDLPTIDKIRINANDSGLVLSYPIEFITCSMSTNFDYISVADVTYTTPSNTIKTLTGVSIIRK